MALSLVRAGRPVATVFDLLGEDENDMSAALGYALSQSPALTRAVIRDVSEGWEPAPALVESHGIIALQSAHRGHGITDVEISLGKDFHGVIEAKRGAHLPTLAQLQQYAPLLTESLAVRRVLLTLTDVAPTRAAASSLPSALDGVRIMHRTWRQIRTLAHEARANEGHAAKRVLDQFAGYLGAILGMETHFSNLVYVVSLASGFGPGWGISWQDVVRKERRYFYPVGKGWPEPPNYIAFRYDSCLQSIHHVERHSVYTNHRSVFPEAPDAEVPPHYCLVLGPAIIPPHELRNGPRIVRAARCWCMLDTLLTASTISEALEETQRRMEA
ncbi:hypothetical protein JYJ95_07195 [Corallococcus exiguus]|uniref:hypothetical protein n=1 Tax=Corallococcus exiguus TaxID=83462 RepID=UPI001A8FFB8F|nr:hypothetical protein [Corallococcus exiguus]MBN8466292.1 hypothetical protein [Corallococcus exiguus]